MRVHNRILLLITLAVLLAACGGDDKSPHPATPLDPTTPTLTQGTTGPRTPDGPEWSTRAVLPTPRAEVAGVVLDGRIYVIGGVEASGKSSNVVEVYDPAADRWQRRANLPQG